MKKEILVIGKEPSDFYQHIGVRLRNKGWNVNLVEFVSFNPKRIYSDAYSKTTFDFIRVRSKLSYFVSLFYSSFWRFLFLRRSVIQALKTSHLKAKVQKLCRNVDVVNIHFLDHWACEIAMHIPNGVPVVFSFWGSDLFSKNEKLVAAQHRSLNVNKNISITLHSEEMERIFLNKFGQHFAPYINKVLFGISTKFINGVRSVRHLKRLDACEFFNLPENKILVHVSYCAFSVGNHNKVIHQIMRLPESIKEQLHFIFPLTYGDNVYKRALLERLEYLNISFTAIEEFLNHERLIILRKTADIYIHVNKTDALSNSLLEYLACGSVAIVGEWLPYSILNKHNIEFKKIKKISDLSGELMKVVNNLQSIKSDVKKNFGLIDKNFNAKVQACKWEKIYKNRILSK